MNEIDKARVRNFIDWASFALIVTPGTLIGSKVIPFASRSILPRALSALTASPSRYTALQSFARSGRSFLHQTPLLRSASSFTSRVVHFLVPGLRQVAENNFPKAALLLGTHILRHPDNFTQMGLMDFLESLNTSYGEGDKKKVTIFIGVPLAIGIYILAKKWEKQMELPLKTIFAFAAGRHQFNRIRASNAYEQNSTHQTQNQTHLQDMLAESILFGTFSGIATFGGNFAWLRRAASAACAVDDPLPFFSEMLQKYIPSSPLTRN